MKNFINVTLINMFALFIVSHTINGIIISSWQTLLLSAVVLSLINIYLKPIIKLITLPVNLLTLGFFTLFINAFLLTIVESLVKGFYIKNFSTAFIGAILLSLIYLFVEKFVIVRNVKFYSNEKPKQNINKDNIIDVEGTYEKDENIETGKLEN